MYFKYFVIPAILLIAMAQAIAQEVSQSEAEELVQSFIGSVSKSNGRGAFKSIAKTHVKNYNAHKSYYIMNLNEGGFVMMSATKNYAPILAYSLDGTYDPNDLSPEFVWWMSSYDKEIDKAITKNIKDEKHQTAWSNLPATNTPLPSSSDYLIHTIWSQFYDISYTDSDGIVTCTPTYNKFAEDGKCSCNKCPAGCVPVAVGQIQRYWEYPRNVNWCNMPQALTSDSKIPEVDEVATLLFNIGKSVGLTYCGRPCASGAPTANAIAFLSSIGYSVAVASPTTLRVALDQRKPIFTTGNNVDGIGHAWVIDGYDPLNTALFHFNWGWGGSSNGYYFLDNHTQANNMRYYAVSPDNSNSEWISLRLNQSFTVGSDAVVNYNPKAGTIISAPLTADAKYRTIPIGVTSLYSASNLVQLKPGFNAVAGSSFRAIVQQPACILPKPTQSWVMREEQDQLVSEPVTSKNIVTSYPNPFSSSLNFKINLEYEESFTIKIHSLTGVLLFETQNTKPAGDHILTYNLYSLVKGMYTCQFSTSKHLETFKIVKE